MRPVHGNIEFSTVGGSASDNDVSSVEMTIGNTSSNHSLKGAGSNSLDATDVSASSGASSPVETPHQSNRAGIFGGCSNECRGERRHPPSPPFESQGRHAWRDGDDDDDEEEKRLSPPTNGTYRSRVKREVVVSTRPDRRQSRSQEGRQRQPKKQRPAVQRQRSSRQDIPCQQSQRQPSYFAFWSSSHDSSPLFSHSAITAAVFILGAVGFPPLAPLRRVVDVHCSILVRTSLFVTAVLAWLHRTGALRRFVLRFAEHELSKVCNGAEVTLSDLRLDLLRGRIVAQDLVIHNKDRDLWLWESPCLARVGRIEATLNFASVIELPRIRGLWSRGPILGHDFKDIYTALVEDVQVFVEKRRNVLNFHLLDPSLDIPDHTDIMKEYLEPRTGGGGKKRGGEGNGASPMSSPSSLGSGGDAEATDNAHVNEGEFDDRKKSNIANNTCADAPRRNTDDSNVEAEKIVQRLVGAVSNLGKAANEGGSRAIQSALRDHREGWVKTLKQLQDAQSSIIPKGPSNGVAEGMVVMRRLGKVVEQNVTNIKESVAALQKPPAKKAGWVEKPPDTIRIGAFMVRELRIFTKDIIVLNSKKPANNGGAGGGSDNLYRNGAGRDPVDGTDGATRSTVTRSEGWSRPIVIWGVAVTGAEFSPLMSARDQNTGLPVVGIPINRVVDIILTKLLTELAKSNSGRLFQAAFGDVFSVVDVSAANGSPRRRRSAKASS